MKRARFPGFAACMRMMRRHNPQVQEDGFHALQPRAAEFVGQLVAEYKTERDHGLRCWLLELLGDARDPQALPVFLEAVRSEDESLRSRAVRGLEELATPDARRALFEAGREDCATTPSDGTKRRPRDR